MGETMSSISTHELAVFVYMRNSVFQNMPMELKKLCLLYYSFGTEWDKDLHGASMEIVDNGKCVKMIEKNWGSAYLTGEYCEGIHHWKFKIEHGPYQYAYFLIGIWKPKSTKYGTPILNKYFTQRKHNGYAFDIKEPKLTNPARPGGGGPKYAVRCHQNDVIEMYLDFNTLMLTFSVNGTYYPNGQKIENTEYKAAITMHGTYDKIRFISYDNLKSNQILKLD